MSGPYKHPPITEAVIEFRFAGETKRNAIEKAARALKSEYAFEEVAEARGVGLNMQVRQATPLSQWLGIKLTSFDRTELQLFLKNGFACSTLAPYPGWEAFRDRAKRGWEAWREAAGSNELVRMGVRYLNRIDVPKVDATVVPGDYITVRPVSPEAIGDPMTSYAVQIVRPLAEDQCLAIINTGTMTSPLVGYTSFVLDIDVSRDRNLPRRDDAIWGLLERIRDHKNRIFELCITDNSRALFNQ